MDVDFLYNEGDLRTDLLLTVIAISWIVDAFIVFIIFKFKKLRREPTYFIIANLSLTEAMGPLLGPLVLKITSMVFIQPWKKMLIYSIFFTNIFNSTVAVCFFLFLLVPDWYLKTYKEAKYVKFKNVYKVFTVSIYVYLIILNCMAIWSTYLFNGFITMVVLFFILIILVLCYVALLILLSVMNIFHLTKKRILLENKHNLGLVVANIFCLFWIPGFALAVLKMFAVDNNTIVAVCISGYANPLFKLMYMLFYVNSFKVYVKNVFRCRCSENGSELLEEQLVIYSDVNGVKIDDVSCRSSH